MISFQDFSKLGRNDASKSRFEYKDRDFFLKKAADSGQEVGQTPSAKKEVNTSNLASQSTQEQPS